MAGLFSGVTAFFLYLLLTSTLGPLLFGYHLAELNAPQDVITCTAKTYSDSRFPLALPQCIPMTTFQFGLVSSIFTVGGFVGALTSGPIAAKRGRLNAMRYTTIVFIIGPVAEACANSVAMLGIGRFISGLGAGASVVVAPLYISEISPVGKKGFFGAFTQVMVNGGILITQVLGYFLSRGQLWRIILGFGGVIGLVQLAALLFAVESPKWGADHGKPELSKRSLQRIRGRDYDIREETVTWGEESGGGQDDEIDALLHSTDRGTSSTGREQGLTTLRKPFDKKQSVGMYEVLVHPRYQKAVIAVMVVMVAQQFCGINSIVMYGVSLLSTLLEQSSALLNVSVSAINVLVTIACAPLPDRIGRKRCLIYSIVGMGTSSLLLGIAILRNIPILSAITVLTFVGSFGIGLGPVPFILSSELVGTEAVGATQSWALGANWTATFIVAQFFPVVNEALGKGKVYFIFAALAAGFATFVAFVVPETMGKKDADEVWGRQGPRDDRLHSA